MKLIKTKEAVGHVLCHDMTQIIPGVSKGPRFKKGHIVAEEDIPVLLSMGKENLYVLELSEGDVHENDAALRLANICKGENMNMGSPSEGKIELFAEIDGLLEVDKDRLKAVNMLNDVMIATRHGNTGIKKGDKLAGTRVIPLVVNEQLLLEAEAICKGGGPLMNVKPYELKTAAVIVTGGEVYRGLVEDSFGPVVINKLRSFGVETVFTKLCDDKDEDISAAIAEARSKGVHMIMCTGGMSVDPDDRTPGAIKKSGARLVTYGAPTLPGAMFLLAYFEDGTPIMGLPGCVMFAKSTIFDLALPRILAGEKLTKSQIADYGYGGLCLGCKECHYPVCPFGKGV